MTRRKLLQLSITAPFVACTTIERVPNKQAVVAQINITSGRMFSDLELQSLKSRQQFERILDAECISFKRRMLSCYDYTVKDSQNARRT